MDKKEDRPRGKSPDRDRRRAEIRHETNRMDPHSVRCRIFIGNLATEKVARQELEEMFGKYGQIGGCSVHNNYGFVQFETEKAADEAVAKEDGKMFMGKKIDVHLVSDKRRKGPPTETRDSGRGGMRGGRGGRERNTPPRDRGRMDDYGGRYPSRFDHPEDRFGRPPSPPRRDGYREPFDRPDDYHSIDRYRDDPYDRRDLPPPRRMYDNRRDPYDYPPRGDPRGDPRDPYYDHDFRRDGPRRDDFRHDRPLRDDPRRDDPRRDDPRRDEPRRGDPRRDDPRRDDLRRDEPRRDEPYGRYDSYSRDHPDDYGPPSKKSRPEYSEYNKPIQAPTDCVVIVVNKVLIDYGTMVERKFKDSGLVTDLQLLGMQSMAELLDSITRHGVLYAAVVTSQHEVHRSVTINILHGTPQEHRNMPLEDALRLVSQNFDQYMQDLRKRAGELDKDKDKEREHEKEREREKEHARELEKEKEHEREKSSRSSYGVPAATKPVPQESDEMKKLLGKAATGGQLSSDELSKLIENLSKQKKQTETQASQSTAGGPSTSQQQTDANSIAKQQADLQAKIMSILNPSTLSKVSLTVAQSASGNSSLSTPTAKPPGLSNPSAPLFPAAKALSGPSNSGYGGVQQQSGGYRAAAPVGHATQQQSSASTSFGVPKAPVPSWHSGNSATSGPPYSSHPAAPSYGNKTQHSTPSSTSYGIPKASPTSYGVPKASPTGYGVPKPSPTSYGVAKTAPNSYGVPKSSPTMQGGPSPGGRGAPANRGGFQGSAPGRGGIARGGPPPGVTAVRGGAPPPNVRGGVARGGAYPVRGSAPRGQAPPTRGYAPRGGAPGGPRYGVPAFRGPAPQGAPISTVQGRGRQPPRY